jgi:hypothetical protein
VAVTDERNLALARAAGMIAIVTGAVPPGAIDVRRMATNEAIGMLEKRGILGGHDEQLLQGEGI